MRKDKSKTSEPKARYQVRNWSTYNTGLINRGNMSMWIDEAALEYITDFAPAHDRRHLYSDALIQALLGFKTVFRLPMHAL